MRLTAGMLQFRICLPLPCHSFERRCYFNSRWAEVLIYHRLLEPLSRNEIRYNIRMCLCGTLGFSCSLLRLSFKINYILQYNLIENSYLLCLATLKTHKVKLEMNLEWQDEDLLKCSSKKPLLNLCQTNIQSLSWSTSLFLLKVTVFRISWNSN